MNSLNTKRVELANNYQDLFELITRRKEIVKEIFVLKEGQPAFNPEIESLLFQLEFFKKLTLKELLSFSLLIEDHAASFGNYPKWSEGVHLKTEPSHFFEMINPLLLKTVAPDYYLKLSLKSEFADLLDNR